MGVGLIESMKTHPWSWEREQTYESWRGRHPQIHQACSWFSTCALTVSSAWDVPHPEHVSPFFTFFSILSPCSLLILLFSFSLTSSLFLPYPFLHLPLLQLRFLLNLWSISDILKKYSKSYSRYYPLLKLSRC